MAILGLFHISFVRQHTSFRNDPFFKELSKLLKLWIVPYFPQLLKSKKFVVLFPRKTGKKFKKQTSKTIPGAHSKHTLCEWKLNFSKYSWKICFKQQSSQVFSPVFLISLFWEKILDHRQKFTIVKRYTNFSWLQVGQTSDFLGCRCFCQNSWRYTVYSLGSWSQQCRPSPAAFFPESAPYGFGPYRLDTSALCSSCWKGRNYKHAASKGYGTHIQNFTLSCATLSYQKSNF